MIKGGIYLWWKVQWSSGPASPLPTFSEQKVTLQFLPLENAPKPMEIPAKDPKIMEKVLYNFDLLSHIGCYLDAESIILNCSIVNKHFLHLLDGSNKTMENHFRVLLSKDFKVDRDARMTRSQGYYRQLYLDCREEQIMEDNLICGGH